MKEGITDPVDLKKSVDEELGPEPSIMDETGSPKRKGAVLQEEVDKVERSLKMKKVADANES